ncbi:GerAB/ArcD/ProY family transporter [Paenibacillus monticola]|uniref:GerAB/ArcD/ProY family transporter n=1 Tax=Paenibacillus monticola TaxID=2666075 RepID=A0A7X2HA33_9BACL|nr:endospore germination permease [Paenibacillus monticola]MRN56195.1 GerAB/ArcD/ProY family transporter [Paenibacillus monticola]
MMKQTKISTLQFTILTFGLTVGTSILVTPSGMARVAREDAWLASLCSLLINIVMVLLYIALSRLHPGKSLFGIMEMVLGKWLGKALTLIYLFYFLILTGTLLGDLGFFITSEFMPETPIEAIQIVFLIAAIVSARMGIVVLARFGELMFPWILLLLLILVLTLVPQIQWNHIMPILEDGWLPVLTAGFQSAMFQEMIVLMVFLPLVTQKHRGERAFLWGTSMGGLLLSVIVLLSVLVLGIEQTENSTFPAFALAKTINIGNFLQRVEGILVTIWILTFFIKISLLFLSLLQGLRNVFGLQRQNHLIYPLAVLFIIIAWNTYINTVYINNIIQQVWWKFSFLHLLLFPLLVYLTAVIRKKLVPSTTSKSRSPTK